MALLNTGCSVSTIQADITGLTTGYAAECFAILAGAVDGATSDRCVTVPNSGSLPSLYPTQRVPDGQVLFVEDVGVPVIAASGKWIGFDKRVLRSDLPIFSVYNWGYNLFGGLGDGSTTSRLSPVAVSGGGTTWSSVSAGWYHSAGVKRDGTLWAWGYNGLGQLGDGTTTSRLSPVTVAGGGTNWLMVNGGLSHTLAIKTDGTLWTWGCNGQGRLGDGTTTNRSSPGTVAGGGTTWCAASVGFNHSAGIKTDGTLWTWGGNNFGQLGDGTTTSRSSPGTVAGGGNNWCMVSVQCLHTVAIKTDGTLWTWGGNNAGQLGDGTLTSRSSPSTVAGAGTNWCAVNAGGNHTAAIKTDGTLWTWGFNLYGQLGDGSSTARSSPGTVAGGGTNWKSLGVGVQHTSAIKTDGTLWSWGCNGSGRLGDNSTTNRSSPGTVIGAGVTWYQVSGGGFHTSAIRS
jgi:alpha-tubulin suppressor-like RCC1 family protein